VTVIIGDDLGAILRLKARERNRPLTELVNAALRKGLAENSAEKPGKVTVRPHDFGAAKAGLDFDRLNEMVDELATEDHREKVQDCARH